MLGRTLALGMLFPVLISIAFVSSTPLVRAQYSNGPIIWVDFAVLNQTRTLTLSQLNGFLWTEVLHFDIENAIVKSERPSVSVSGGGSYYVGQLVLTQANIWTGQDNKTSNSLDYVLQQVSINGSPISTVQTIHVYNVPGAVGFSLADAYTFSSQGSYNVLANFNGELVTAQNSTAIQVANQPSP